MIANTCARGETDITTVFGTVVAGSIPAERTMQTIENRP